METIRLASGLEYYQVWDNDGAIIMTNAKTVDRYCELQNKAIRDLNDKKDYGSFDKMKEAVAKECDPQEVYFYEYNNYECMYSDDDEAIGVIIDIFGVEVAKTIKRYSAGHSIDYILIPQWIKHEWLMLERLIRDCEYYLGNGNRCAKHLWAHDEREQIAEMRKRLASLPEEHRPKWASSEVIDKYESKMLNLQPVEL